MQKNLIFCALAYDDQMQSGVNVSKVDGKWELYIKNVFVALSSAKINNMNSDVALVTNTEISSEYQHLFSEMGILIFQRDFDSFRFDNNYKWGLAFYKLCSLKKMLELKYDNYLIMDTDVYVQSGLDDLWKDTESYLMLFDINHRPSTPHSVIFDTEVKKFCGINRSITNWGGEFIAGNYNTITQFINRAEYIYCKMNKQKFVTDIGDEFITRLVADEMNNVKNAGGYIFRFWTNTFRLVSTCYSSNAVSVLHVPNEKKYGMLVLFEYISKHKKLPKVEVVHKTLHLINPSMLTRIKKFAICIRTFIRNINKINVI